MDRSPLTGSYTLTFIRDFSKHWNAGELLRNLRKVNPNFYPQPILEAPSGDPGVKANFKDRDLDYLSEKQFVEVYGRCGVILHASNPYGHGIDVNFYSRNIPEWRARIINLLNSHKVNLVDDTGFYLVHMREDRDDEVHYYRFEPAPAGS